MKNTTVNIGNRIKEIRLQKNLTQNELCGTELTRNHLSLIESGKSLPSVKTICYIADRLDIPVGYLFSADGNEEARFTSIFAIDEIKSAYFDRDFNKVINICKSIPNKLRSDEISYWYAKAEYTTSLSYAEKLDIISAVAHIRNAAGLSDNCSYLTKDFTSACEYYELLFTSLSSEAIPQRLTDYHEISSYVSAEIVMYLKMLSSVINDETVFTSTRHRQHYEARRLMNDGNSRHAYDLLLELSSLTSLPYYMKYRVFSDLEKCAEDIGEYKTAYTASRQKNDLIKRM